MRNIHLLLAVLFCGIVNAQNFDFSAPLEPVTESGYHRIILSPELVGRSRLNGADLRLKDNANQTIPYVLRKEERIAQNESYMSFSVVRNEIIPNKYTVLEIKAESKNPVDQIHLEVANADVIKSVEITGSDDQKQWFAVRSTQVKPVPRNDRNTSTLSVLHLPLTRHNFYRMTIADSLSAPLKILNVGHKGRVKKYGLYDEAVGYRIQTEQHDQTTEIKVSSAYPIHMDRLRIDLDSATQFYRQVRLFDFATRKLNRREKRQGVEAVKRTLITHGVLSSEQGTTLNTEGVIVDTLIIEIDNGDDAPLEILDLHLEQLRRSLITKLEAETSYSLFTGNTEVNSPRYDLLRFINDSTPLVAELHHAPIEDHRTSQKGALKALSRNWMWLVIGALAIFMLFMVSRMMKEQNMNTHQT